MGSSSTLEEIKFDRGWSQERLDEELFKRKVVLAYLIENGLNSYTEVAATVQAFINDPETILTIIANERLERSLEDLREMESVQIEIDPDEESQVPRPEPGEELLRETAGVLENATPLFDRYQGMETSNIVSALQGTAESESAGQAESHEEEAIDFGQFVPKAGSGDEGEE
jgi:flagellar protein FlaI